MCMRLEGLPLAAFCCKDPQSDRASAQRLCPKFVPQTWQGDGCLLMAFFGAVFSSVFNCPLGTRVAFQNACFGFYVALLHLAEGKRKYGQAWQSKCLPWQTVRNLAHLCAHGILHCLHGARQTPWRLQSRQERCCEVHFSKVKSHCRGTPSLKDALLGEYLENLKTLRQADRFVFPTLPVGEPLADPDDLARDALTQACWMQSAISSGRTAANIHSDLVHWYNLEGKAMLTYNLQQEGWKLEDGEMEDPDGADAAVEVLADNEEDQAEAEAGKQLEACEDHLKAVGVCVGHCF